LNSQEITKGGQRLIGWKAIGYFLGCSGRTAMRWEAERALPVRRLPGGRGSVWANPDELSAWLRSIPEDVRAAIQAETATGTQPAGEELERAPVADPGARPAGVGERRRRISGLAALVSIVLAGLGGAALWGLLRARAPPALPVSQTPYDDDARARELYLDARLEVSTRTARSLREAERSFRWLVRRYPDRAVGWAGLADTYVLLPEFASEPGAVLFPQAARAARTAIALDPKLAAGWLDRAYVAWWWQGDAATAFPAFATALRLDPGSARAYHWYATALETHGQFRRALTAIARARALDPGNRAIVADEAVIRFDSGQRRQALATIEQLAQIDPQFVSWHLYLAHCYLLMGRDADYLHQAMTVARLRGLPDVVAALHRAEERLRTGGREAMLNELSASDRRGDHGAGYAVSVAKYQALAGNRAAMLHWLRVALAQHDHDLVRAAMYLEFERFRSDPEFRKIVTRAIEQAASDAALANAK
jgi:tetratricopeptide (TPR) repeat protein